MSGGAAGPEEAWTTSPASSGSDILGERLRLFTRLIFSFVFAGVLLKAVFLSIFGPSLHVGVFDHAGLWAVHLSMVGALFVLWRFVLAVPRSRHLLMVIDAVVPVAMCAVLCVLVYPFDSRMRADLGLMLGLTNVLVARAALVPSTKGRTLVIGALVIVPAVTTIHATHMRDHVAGTFPTPAQLAMSLLVWCLFSLATTGIISKVTYGLRREVAEARRLGQYTLVEKLGEGGMGVVYKASHALLRRPTAIKLLPSGRAGEADLQRFEREVQLTSLLTHPNTISIYDYGRTDDGVFYYAMEFLDGVDLEALVHLTGPQHASRVAHLLRQASDALAEAHGVGLIHRDIKPANVLLCERGGTQDFVKVLDFGLVKSLAAGASDVSLTNVNAITGTPQYLSPEAITDPTTVDGRSDVYALGAVGYFLLTGVPVFEATTVVEICSHHLLTRPVPPSERLGRPVPAAIESLVLACLAKEPAARPASAHAVVDALTAFLAQHPWTKLDARDWWDAHGDRIRGARLHLPVLDALGSTVAVDCMRRGAA